MKFLVVTIQTKGVDYLWCCFFYTEQAQVVLTFQSVDKTLKGEHQMKLLNSTFLWCCYHTSCSNVGYVDEILKCDHSNENYFKNTSCSVLFFFCRYTYNEYCIWINFEHELVGYNILKIKPLPVSLSHSILTKL